MDNVMKLPDNKNYINVSALPAINKIIWDAEEQLTAICGSKVNVLVKIPTVQELNFITLQQKVCEAFDVSWKNVSGRGRKKSDNTVYARFAYCYLCKRLLPHLSLSAIGETIGGRHHTTVIHAVAAVQDYLDTKDKAIAPMVGIMATLMSNERVKTA